MLPQLIKMLFGIESVFAPEARSAVLNTTFFAGMLGLTFSVRGPILKTVMASCAVFTASRWNPARICAQNSIRGWLLRKPWPPWLCSSGRCCLGASPLRAADAFGRLPARHRFSSPVPGPRIWDAGVGRTVHEDKYTLGACHTGKSRGTGRTGGHDCAVLRQNWRHAAEVGPRVFRSSARREIAFSETPPAPVNRLHPRNHHWIEALYILLYGLVAVALAALALLVYRIWQGPT